MRIREWLERVPTTDAFERRAAVTVQIFCVGLSVLMAANQAVRLRVGPSATTPSAVYGVFADYATIAASLAAVVLIRRGLVRRGFVLVIGGYVAILTGSLLLRGLSYHKDILVRVYPVLIVLPALLLGRRALWTTVVVLLAGMLAGHLRDDGLFGGGGPLPAPVAPFGIFWQAVAVLLLLCVVLDRFGAALREAYAEAVRRREEAERATRALVEANESLSEEGERRRSVEAALLQSQKLESVGRLSAGLAHDFNNVLTAIVGFAELGKLSIEQDHPLREDLRQIVSSAQRAAALTRQMLAFARRQIVEPRTLVVEERIQLLLPMLRRSIGEQVRIEERFASDPWTIRIDPVQLDQVLVNLAVNARDAMPSGGTLTVETSRAVVGRADRVVAFGLEPGEHVRLSITDTGIGMDARTLENVFEPFFTTKAGTGTGLGLATVYGIVRQAGGAITVESIPGRGTRFDLFFPRAGAPEESVAPRPVQSSRSARTGQTVLLVEDDPQILAVAARTLRGSGLSVLTASSPEGAKAVAAAHPGEIALLVTDVVMPGMDGRKLSEELRRTRPKLAVLYVSGHSDEIIARHGVLEPGVHLLSKPFTPEALVEQVRKMLEMTSLLVESA